jgi:hypothetical protein
MPEIDEPTMQPGARNRQTEPSLWRSEDDLSDFALPTGPSELGIEAAIRRNPLTALIAAVLLGVVIGKSLR